MATNPRFEISSNSPDGASFPYANSHRSHYAVGAGGTSLDRTSSFRDGHEGGGRTLTPVGIGSSVPSQGATGSHGELPPLVQVLSLELIPTGEKQYAKQHELRRAIHAAMAMSGDVQANVQQKPLEQQGIEELKRMKASLLDNAAKARERSCGLVDAITKLDKYHTALQSRKRARVESLAHERSLIAGSGERQVPVVAAATTTTATMNPNKAGFCPSPSHASIADGTLSILEGKNKGSIPNKRVRTSMLDVRLESRASMPGFQRPSGLAARDRESMKSSTSMVGLAEDRLIAMGGGEAWERNKTKGRRSMNKSDCALATSGATEFDREHKWGAQHRNNVGNRNNVDNRQRSTEGHSFRSGPVHGVVSIHKSASRNEPESTMSVREKESRIRFPEKERTTHMSKTGLKLTHKEDGSPSSQMTIKAKAARAPRSGIGMPMHSSGPHAPRPLSSADAWDHAAMAPIAPSRPQIPVAPNNRKRPAPTRSSSPPVAQWVGQRPQKISRVARRMNIPPPLVPAGAVQDEALANADGHAVRDSCPTPTAARSNLSTPPMTGLVKRVASTATLLQAKSRSESLASLAGLSDSEDSGVDVKAKDKWKKHVESEGRFAPINQKMAPLFLPGKKSRVGPKEEGADSIRRQGRSGRGFIAVRESSNVTFIKKGDSSGNAKQLRSGRPGFDKLDKPADVKLGRPPTKKGGMGDRKSLMRPRRPATSGGGEVSGESDDEQEELLAAMQAAVNASVTACSSVFWKEMEPFFAYLTPDARDSLKIQVKDKELEDEEAMVSPLPSDTKTNAVFDSSKASSYMANGRKHVNGCTLLRVAPGSHPDQASESGKKEMSAGWPILEGLPLSQRLLAALIIESDIEDDSSQPGLQGFGGDEFLQDLSDSEHVGLEKDQDSESEVETRTVKDGKLIRWVKSSYHEALYTSNGNRHWDSESEILSSPLRSDLRKEDNKHSFDINRLKKWEVNYQDMTLDERITLELRSIDLYPEQGEVVREDQIAEEIKKSHLDLKELVLANKERLSVLERVVSHSQAGEERERERLAMIKLLENAFSKRLGPRGGHLGVSGSKHAASKTGHAVAVTIAKKSLARWKHFMETGESCFTEASLRDTLFCIPTKDGETKAVANMGINAVGLLLTCSPQLKLAGSANTRWICHASGLQEVDKDSCESDHLVACTPLEWMGDKDDVWCSRLKEREVLLEDVVGSGANVGSVLFGTKGKRSERERDSAHVKGAGRQGSFGAIKGERKTKAKPRQKTAPLLKAVNGLLDKPSGLPEKPGTRVKQENVIRVDTQAHSEGLLDLPHLQIPSMDDLVVNGDLGGQGQDLGSWLDFDDPGLPDAGGDFMGLDVPMDDLADLAMMM